ncbi:NAD(P)-dependent oxidoreductase [Brochothrix thermosphacta]|uniref:NAD(P)-dependent oxidoreductase n=1 Tax=Brochothrix thermosphacta TaxID=2756 RepID=UPI000D78CA9C|nr:NAD(P)-dependent oxidoreductase [Brochothrix thermosphacta]SPN75185.1 beta-hydroxyacid dehydrogenase (acts on 3-hydroxypropionate with NADP) [Brochothrix thermosphacta]
MANVGFIGTGVMGTGMIKQLLAKGTAVKVYTRTAERAQKVLDEGATYCETAKELAQQSDIVFTMVGYPKDVETLYLGTDGILGAASTGTIFIDMTTSSPTLARELSAKASVLGKHVLDAPVSGGDIGAQNGTLSIMVGGERAAFEQVLPLFEKMGKTIVYQGDAGNGQNAKMVNQIAVAGTMLGVVEALVYAKKMGLDEKTVLESIETGAAGSWTLSNLGPRIIADDFEPGFFIKHFVKDMTIASNEAAQNGFELPGLQTAKRLYEVLENSGLSEKGTQALYHYYFMNK